MVTSGETQRVHIEDDGDIFGQGELLEGLLDVAGEWSGRGRAKHELKAELPVGLDQWARQRIANNESGRWIFGEPTVNRLEGEFGAAFMGRAAGEHGAAGKWRETKMLTHFEFLLGKAIEVVMTGKLDAR